MRFNKLTLAAFLSFKDRTEIDFKQFGNKLMLLFGGSGVGKTAIFDGVSFALYGRGSGKDRCAGKVEDYHSDFAKEQDDQGIVIYHAPMLVELEFEHDGKQYLATRQIKWGEKGKNVGFKYEMELKCDGATIATDTKNASNGTYAGNSSDKVTEKIMEMLGLNADQFSQVVILAQGEFAKFLNANAQEREKILTKLVDNDHYVDFQTRLRELANYLQRLMKQIDAEIKTSLNLLLERESISEPEKEQYKIVDAQLLQNLEVNLRSREDALAKLEQDIQAAEVKLDDLNKEKGAADAKNKAYDESLDKLEKAQNALAELKRGFNIQRWRQSLVELELLQQILPKSEAFVNAGQELQTNQETIDRVTAAVETLEKQCGDFEVVKQKTEAENKPKISALEGSIKKLEDALKVYPKLKSGEEELVKLQTDLQKAETAADSAQRKLQGAQESIKADEKILAGLGNAVAEKMAIGGQLLAAQEKLEKLETLQQDIKSTSELEEECQQKQKLEEQAKVQNDKCMVLADEKRQEFYAAERRANAGALANSVREQVELQGLAEVECPVCHTRHKVDALKQWESCMELPEKTALAKAEKNYREAGEKYAEAKSEYASCSATYQEKCNQVMITSAKFLEVSCAWKVLKELTNVDNPLIKLLTEQIALVDRLKREDLAVKEKAKQQEELEASLSSDKQALPSLEQAAKEAVAAVAVAKEAVNQQMTLVAEQKGALKECPASEKEAKAALTELKQKKEKLHEAVEAANKNYNTCAQELSSNKGQLKQSKANHQPLVEKLARCKTEYEAVLEKCEWTETEFKASHDKNRNNKGEKLVSGNVAEAVKKLRSSIENYDRSETAYTHTIVSLTEELKDKQRLDTTELETKLKEVKAKLNTQGNKRLELKGDIEINKQVLETVSKQFRNRQKKQKVLNAVEPLDDVANGSITFNRYVLEDLFCTMLDKANDRLNVLCSGQYELKPIEEGDAKKNKGLGFTVYDCINQSHRSSDANSGGEKFEISLSLALGLSDIVQSCSKKASRIECLFIDEGFGTLGKEELEKTKRMLLDLSGGARQIGVISHNPILEEAIKNQIIVERDKHSREGTQVSFNVD